MHPACQCVLLVFFYLHCVTALYFHIQETETKCFIEELPDETLLVGKYKVEVFDKSRNKFMPTVSGLGMHVTVRGPDGNIILSRAYAAEGRFSFTTHSAGEHTICLHSNSSAWFGGGQLRVHLDMQIGDHANDYQEIATKDKLTDIQLRVRQLLDQVETISKEQSYQRTREEKFRDISDSTNHRVLYWSIIQTVILVATGFWQMRHLKTFFEAKKLV